MGNYYHRMSLSFGFLSLILFHDSLHFQLSLSLSLSQFLISIFDWVVKINCKIYIFNRLRSRGLLLY